MPYATTCGTIHEPGDRCGTLLGAARLPMREESVAVARLLVVNVARVWNVPNDVLDIAELLASEIVTNAVVHAKGPRDGTVWVAALRSGERLIVECHDPSRDVPRLLLDPEPLRENGRGLCLVTNLAYDSGVHLTEEPGKSVWFELVAWPY